MYDFVPVLSGGAHNSPEKGACVMEMVSFMSGDKWTDSPKCTNQHISYAAQSVNDRLSEQGRQKILTQFDRLFNTSDPEFADAFEKEYAVYLMDRASEGTASSGYAQDWLVGGHIEDGMGEITISLQHLWPEEDADEELVKFLSDILDIYDHVSGRTNVEVQDLNKLKGLVPSV